MDLVCNNGSRCYCEYRQLSLLSCLADGVSSSDSPLQHQVLILVVYSKLT